MPRAQLATDIPRSGATIFFDASPIYALAVDRGATVAGFPAGANERTRAAALRAFISRVNVGLGLRTTVLVLEEIATKAQRTYREESAKAAGHKTWKAFWYTDRPAALVASTTIGFKTLQLVEWAVQEIDAQGIEIERASVLASERTTAARRLHREHMDLLNKCPWLEPMDALHILKGVEIGASEFVTFDLSWANVPGLVVYDG